MSFTFFTIYITHSFINGNEWNLSHFVYFWKFKFKFLSFKNKIINTLLIEYSEVKIYCKFYLDSNKTFSVKKKTTTKPGPHFLSLSLSLLFLFYFSFFYNTTPAAALDAQFLSSATLFLSLSISMFMAISRYLSPSSSSLTSLSSLTLQFFLLSVPTAPAFAPAPLFWVIQNQHQRFYSEYAIKSQTNICVSKQIREKPFRKTDPEP